MFFKCIIQHKNRLVNTYSEKIFYFLYLYYKIRVRRPPRPLLPADQRAGTKERGAKAPPCRPKGGHEEARGEGTSPPNGGTGTKERGTKAPPCRGSLHTEAPPRRTEARVRRSAGRRCRPAKRRAGTKERKAKAPPCRGSLHTEAPPRRPKGGRFGSRP